jgi:hypothetical protein
MIMNVDMYNFVCVCVFKGDKAKLTFIPRRELSLLKLRSRTSRLGWETRIVNKNL